MKNIILNLLLFLPILAFSQQLSKSFNVSTGTPYKVVDAANKLFTSIGGGFTISTKMHGELVTLQKYDVNGMKEVARNEYKDFPKYSKIQELLEIDNKLYFIFEAYNKSEKTFSLYSREIDTKTCKFNKYIKLFTTTRAVIAPAPTALSATTNGMYGIGMIKKFKISTSFDKTKIMVKYRLKPLKRRDKLNFDEIGFYIFDNNFKKIWGKEYEMPYVEAEMDNLATTVKNNGDAFLLVKVNKTKSFELLSINKDGLEKHVLDVKKGLVFDKFELKQGKKGIIAVGYYANGVEFKVNYLGSGSITKNINGLYIFEIDEKGEVVRKKEYPFSIDLINQSRSKNQINKSNKKEAKGKAGINDLLIKNVTIDNQGNMFVLGEVDYIRNEIYMTSTTLMKHLGNMILTKIDAEGNLIWQKKLPKNQAGVASAKQVQSLGIFYDHGQEATYVLFTDNKKNANITVNDTPRAHKAGFGGYITAFKVDNKTGEVERHLILDLTNIGGIKAYQFQTKRILRADDGVFLLEIYIKGKKDTMVKMEVK